MKTKKLLAALLAATLSTTMLFGCGSSSDADPAPAEDAETAGSTAEAPTEETEPLEYVDASDFAKVYSDADAYKGKGMQFTGQVFSVEEDEDGIYLQVYEDLENYDHNTVVGYPGNDIEVKEDDYVIIDGVIMGTLEGENMLGGTVTAPIIMANTLTISDYITVVSPSIKTLENCGSITQNDVTITVDKVEFAEIETRLYVTVKNASEDEFDIYTYSTNAVQDGKQFEEQTNYDYDYVELNSDLRAGVETSGVITLKPMSPESEFTLYIEGRSDNWDLDFEPFKFDIEVK